MSTLEKREHQMFPVLSAAQVKAAQRFASAKEQHFTPGETLYDIGDMDVPVWLILQGSIEVTRRDGLSHEAHITCHTAGQFSGEINQLSGRGSIAAGKAGPDGCTALAFDAPHLRALMIGSAELGEIVMRALILRRVALIEDGGAGTILIGLPDGAEVLRLQNFLTRSGLPNLMLDVREEGEGRNLVERLGIAPEDLPLVVCPAGNLLKSPQNAELAACLGILPEIDAGKRYDVAIIGAGPAGLATAVYAASEGLSVIVLDSRMMGGQAGASSRIENYLGFPTGISGQALAGRAFNQALKFGAEIAIPVEVNRLDCDASQLSIIHSGDKRLSARTIVIASGAFYRRPDVENLAAFEGRGISYWASPIEARHCQGEEVALVGGGNSAGQAVVFLAPHVKQLHLIIRRPLEQTMSRYLIERIAALPNVQLHTGAEIQALHGDSEGMLEAVTFRNKASEKLNKRPLRHLFLFIGAEPNTAWFKQCIETDAHGFVITGQHALSLETSIPGVFAIGDVRDGSTKRVAAAVGEGASVVSQIHTTLANTPQKAAA